MGLVLEVGVQIRKFVIISKRVGYRSVCNHPFLVGMVLFLILLYRSFPLVFSLLVSASPVLVCTAVLLGTLLSFGQPNIPEIEKEEKLTHDFASLRTGVSVDDTVVVGRKGEFSTERFPGKTRDIVDKSVEEGSYTEYRVSSEIEDREDSAVCVPLIKEDLQHNQNEKRVVQDVERELDSAEFENQKSIQDDELGMEGSGWDREAAGPQYTLVPQLEDDISPQESAYGQRGDYLDSSLGGSGGGDGTEPMYTLVRQMEDISPRESVYGEKGDYLDSSLGGGDGDEEADGDMDDEASDSESDLAESSSPDASMADILPMLDELHPLLDSEAPQPTNISHDESDAASDRSDRSNTGSIESDAESESRNRRVEKDDGVDYNDNRNEEEAQGVKEDESKTAIKWTEDDQKNIMDLGNLELERNLRLENLIARRRARKSFKIMAERDLIDFDSADLPFNVAPISTARQNPFDLPYDPFDNMGLPPIPGSAPSIMSQRRNPFDLPYESNEEKPDLKGDHFEQEFMTFHSKDAFFRRHESFSLGPSNLRNIKQERQHVKWRPVFVPEGLASEVTSSSSFQRQWSDVSDSKLSSVPDTESVSSAADVDERNFSEQEITKETEVISNIYHVHDLVEHGSQSSEDADSLETEQAGKGDAEHCEVETKLGELQNLEPSFSDTGDAATIVEHITSETHLKPEPVQEDNSTRSSFSSLSEVGENISDVIEGSLEATGDIIHGFVISPQPSLQESEAQFMSRMVDDNDCKAPVYDSNPLPTEKILSFSSISSVMQAEISETVTPLVSSEMYVGSMEKGTSRDVKIGGCISEVHASDEIERDLGTHNQLNLPSSPSEEDVHLPKNVYVTPGSSDFGYKSVLSEIMPPSQQDKVLSWSDESMVEPYFYDNVESLNTNEELDEVKEIDPGLLSELDAVGDFSVQEVLGDSLHTDELIRDEANSVGTEFGDLSLSESTQELAVVETRSMEDIDMTFRQIHRGDGVEEAFLPCVVDNQLEVEASENTMQTSSKLPILEAKFEDILSALKQGSEGNVNELPQLVDPEDGSKELPLEYIHSILMQVSEADNVSELPKPSTSMDGMEEAGTAALGSSEEIESDTTLKQVTDSLVDELPKQTPNLEGGLVEEGTNAIGSDEKISSNNIASSAPDHITPHNSLKQVSESHVDELPKLTSNSEERLPEVTNAMGSKCNEEIVSSNAVASSAHDNITSCTAMEQISESHVDELPKPTNSEEGLAVGTNASGSAEETKSSNIASDSEQNIPIHPALKQVSEIYVGELPKPASNSEELTEAENYAVASTHEVVLSATEPSVHEPITTPTALKQVSGSNVDELPKSENSRDGLP